MFLLCCALLWLYIDWFSHIHQAYKCTSLALWPSNDCPSAIKATLMNMDKYIMWIHYERLHNHNKAKHNKTVCIFLGIYCEIQWCVAREWNRDGESSVNALIRAASANVCSAAHIQRLWTGLCWPQGKSVCSIICQRNTCPALKSWKTFGLMWVAIPMLPQFYLEMPSSFVVLYTRLCRRCIRRSFVAS